jgi:tRNA A-37 threonylcarbamoyl transferase component Bud32
MTVITAPRLLSNRYRVEQFIGQGGMASVYRGTDRVLGRKVAIKVLAEQLARDPSFVRRFRREAQAAAGLNHPGIVSVFDTGSDDGIHYIVMELLEGRTLEQITRAEGRLSPERAVEVAGGVCAGLSAAHDRGLVHRDVKPANVMICPDGSVKVMDFGIARAITSNTLTQTAVTLGTATYLSPEQAQGDPVDLRSDIYSLGVVLYELLTGQPPFTADSAVAVAYKHVREQPPAPSTLNPDVGPALEGVVLRAMAKDPAHRYQSAGDLGRDLERTRLGSTEPIAIQRTAELPRPVRRSRRRRRLWPAVLILAAAALAAALVVAILSFPQPAGDRSATPAATPSDPSPPAATTAPPEEPAALTVAAAIDALETVLDDAQANGEITGKAAGEIARHVNEGLREYDRGNLDEALGKIEEVRDQLDQLVEEGEIASSETADRIDGALADLAGALEASPPVDGGEQDD